MMHARREAARGRCAMMKRANEYGSILEGATDGDTRACVAIGSRGVARALSTLLATLAARVMSATHA